MFTLLIFLQWRMRSAERNLLGRTVPELGDTFPSHPDGVLLLFHHPRCGPCKRIYKHFAQLEMKRPLRTLTINLGEQRELALAFGISATPTTLLIKDKIVAKAIIGPKSFAALDTSLKPS